MAEEISMPSKSACVATSGSVSNHSERMAFWFWYERPTAPSPTAWTRSVMSLGATQ